MATKDELFATLSNLQIDMTNIETLYIKGFVTNTTFVSTKKKIQTSINDIIKQINKIDKNENQLLQPSVNTNSDNCLLFKLSCI